LTIHRCIAGNLKKTVTTVAMFAAGEYAMGEQIREILIDEQDHQIALATGLGKSVPTQSKAA